MKLLGEVVPCLVDSGFEATLVTKTLTGRFRKLKVHTAASQVWAANDTPIRINREVRLPFYIEDHCILTTALVSEDMKEVMLGFDWLQEHECVWDFRSVHISIDGRPVVTTTQRGNINCRRVFVQDCQEIPPRTQMNVTARRTLLSTQDVYRDVMVESHELKPGVYVGRTSFPLEHRDLKVCMANTTNITQLIAPGTCFGHAVSAIVVSDETPVSVASDDTPAVVDDTLESEFDKLPGEVSSDQRQRVADLLSEYDDLFSRGTFDMGRTNLVEHIIDTGSKRPIRDSLRRHPGANLDEIDR